MAQSLMYIIRVVGGGELQSGGLLLNKVSTKAILCCKYLPQSSVSKLMVGTYVPLNKSSDYFLGKINWLTFGISDTCIVYKSIAIL